MAVICNDRKVFHNNMPLINFSSNENPFRISVLPSLDLIICQKIFLTVVIHNHSCYFILRTEDFTTDNDLSKSQGEQTLGRKRPDSYIISMI